MSESPEPKRPTVHHIPIKCESPTEKRQITALHAPVPAPPVDDMKPQNISFIGKCFFSIHLGTCHTQYFQGIHYLYVFVSIFFLFTHSYVLKEMMMSLLKV